MAQITLLWIPLIFFVGIATCVRNIYTIYLYAYLKIIVSCHVNSILYRMSISFDVYCSVQWESFFTLLTSFLLLYSIIPLWESSKSSFRKFHWTWWIMSITIVVELFKKWTVQQMCKIMCSEIKKITSRKYFWVNVSIKRVT